MTGRYFAVPLLLAVVSLGCGGPKLELVPVHGRVSLGGKGLSHAAVQLIPDEKKGTTAPTGAGQTDSDGQFLITTPPHGEGAVHGHYKVTVTAYGGNVPRQYADPLKTPLAVEVPPEGLSDWKLELANQ